MRFRGSVGISVRVYIGCAIWETVNMNPTLNSP